MILVALKRPKKGQARHRLPRATDAVMSLSFIFETWRADFRSSYRKTQEKRHWPCNSGDECVLSHEGVTNTFKLKELLNDKEDKETS